MTLDIYACPRCSERIETARRREVVVVCSACGFVISNSQNRLETHSHKTFIHIGIAFCVLLFGALIQISMWDGYFLEVIPLQAKEVMGISKDTDVERMAQICLERKRFNCVEEKYLRLAKKDPLQLLRLGKLQMSRLHYKEAVATFRTFFVKGGKSLDASFMFARALTEIGQFDEAGKYYRYILRSRPDAIMQAAAQNGYESVQKQKRGVGRGLASVPR